MSEPDSLTAQEMAAYEQRLAKDLSGEEQTAMRARDREAYQEWLDTELRHVPMPSRQKPDINGFREGDRVRLTQPFRGETSSYEAGHKGVFLITNTATAHIRLAREVPLYVLFMDGPDSGLIEVGDSIERIHGHFHVNYNNGNVNVAPAALAYPYGERVQLNDNYELDGVLRTAGTRGTILHVSDDPALASKLASQSLHAVVLDNEEIVVVPGSALRPID
jgi:hypothetical protein